MPARGLQAREWPLSFAEITVVVVKSETELATGPVCYLRRTPNRPWS
jgi:hypothetical protein